MPQSPFIDIKNLSVGYTSRSGKTIPVLRDVNLSITRGDSIGLVGESGSGKSTLALAAMGYFKRGLHVISGQVQFDGIDMLNIERNALQRLRGGRLALIPQNSGQSLTPNLRIGQQITEALRLHSDLPATGFDAGVIDLLSQVRLPDPIGLTDRYPHELSGGQQQRVAIAMALASDPEALLSTSQPPVLMSPRKPILWSCFVIWRKTEILRCCMSAMILVQSPASATKSW
jgi:peptide/nickel transport system ATP-binding protein